MGKEDRNMNNVSGGAGSSVASNCPSRALSSQELQRSVLAVVVHGGRVNTDPDRRVEPAESLPLRNSHQDGEWRVGTVPLDVSEVLPDTQQGRQQAPAA